ncbi:MAG: hypothetical protein ABI615_10055 [Chthoniobacterales bacterium]
MKTEALKSNRLFSVRILFVLIGTGILFSGCASDETASRTDTNSPQQNTSAIPWNRPQGWEGSTGYGGMVNQPTSGH